MRHGENARRARGTGVRPPGLTPQSVNVFGGYKVQGRDELAAKQLLQDAQNLELAGIQLLVLECVPTELARQITEALSIPVIGIGAGNCTDGQIP